jgi:hypothetical protein
MNPVAQLIIGCLVLSAGVSYMLWLWVRIWWLREDLFQIRDDLWDAMYAKGQLDHPTHRAARLRINGVIRAAYLLGPITVTIMAASNLRDSGNDWLDDAPPEVLEAVTKVTGRLGKYIAYQNLTGLSIAAVATVLSFQKVTRDVIARWIRRLIGADVGRELDPALRH